MRYPFLPDRRLRFGSKPRRILLNLLFAILPVLPALAAETDDFVPEQSLVASGLKLLAALVIIIGLIYLTALIARRRWRGQGPRSGMRILAHHYVGPRKMIQLLQVGQRGLLIGVTERSITRLGELSEEELIEFQEQPGATGEIPVSGFQRVLRSAFNRRDENA